jgi:hypothetical protein
MTPDLPYQETQSLIRLWFLAILTIIFNLNQGVPAPWLTDFRTIKSNCGQFETLSRCFSPIPDRS